MADLIELILAISCLYKSLFLKKADVDEGQMKIFNYLIVCLESSLRSTQHNK